MKFKNKMGNLLTKGLFYETSLDKDSVVYTLKDEDHMGYPSLYRLYMETGDPTEWSFATTHLDSWSHWEKLLTASWFQEYHKRWKKELELKLRSNALRGIMQTSESDSKESFQARKLLLAGGWIQEEEKGKRGRPSKDEIRQAAADAARSQSRVDDDFDRILGKLN